MDYIGLVIKGLEEKVVNKGFSFSKRKKKDNSIEFKNLTGDFKYLFTIFFNKYDCDGYISLNNKKYNNIFKSIDNSYTYKDQTAIANLSYYVNNENKDGYFNSNNAIRFSLNNKNPLLIAELTQRIYDVYFLKGVLPFIEKTNSINNLDAVANKNLFFVTGKRNLHFNNDILNALIGIMSAYLNENTSYDELVKGYGKYLIEECAPEHPTTKMFFKVVEYLNTKSTCSHL